MQMTGQQLVDRARVPLNDDAKVRWPDAELLGHLVEVVGIVRKARPDLFIDSLLAEPVVTLGAVLPVPYTHYQVLADYVTGRAQMKDGDDTGAKTAELLSLAAAGIR